MTSQTSKIAIVGCEKSGKTVFMAALSDYYRANQRPNQRCCLTPENRDAHRFSEAMRRQMRDLNQWPRATREQDTTLLQWALRSIGREAIIAQIELLDFGGEVFRAAFRGDDSSAAEPRLSSALRNLLDHIIEADFIVVLVSLKEIARDINRTAAAQDLERDEESKWVTRGLLKFLAEHQASNRKVIVALSQADRQEHKELLETYGGAKELFGRAWPTVSACYPHLTVVPVASVSGTTTDDRPAPGFKTDGILSVMKEFVKHRFGDCDATVSSLKEAERTLKSFPELTSPEAFSQKLNEFSRLLQKLDSECAPIAECYKETLQACASFKDTCCQFAEAIINNVERRPLASQADSAYWRNAERLYPTLADTVRSFERYYQRKVEQQQEEARRWQEQDAREVAEHQRRLRQLEEKRLASEQARRERAVREAAEHQRRLRQLEEKRLAAEQARREWAARAKVFLVRMVGVGILLAVLAGSSLWLADAQAEKKDKRKLNQTRAEERVAAEQRKGKEADARAAADWRKGNEAEERVTDKRLKEKEVEERAAADRREQERRDAAVQEMSVLLDELRTAAAREDLELAKEKCAELRRKGATAYHRSVATLFDKFCDHLERAKNGNTESMVWLARQYAGQKTEIKRDLSRAVAWYEKAALAGNAEAMFEFAFCAEVGKGCPQDKQKAMEWYEKAADAGNGNALYRLGYFRAKGLMGLRQSREKAFKLFLEAKTNGCTISNIDAWLEATRPVEEKKGVRGLLGL